YVKSVIDPSAAADRARRYIGRWKLDFDGWQGTLDIYRLPGLFQASELNGHADDRIGTYYHTDGHAYRVNGYLSGNELVFFIDFNIPRGDSLDIPSAPYDDMSFSETWFEAYLFSWDDQDMAGLEHQDGAVYGFNATKLTPTAHVAGSPLGTWKMNHD